MVNNFNMRRKKLLQRTSKIGLDYLLISKPSNMFYFTGLKIEPYERFAGLILQAKSETSYLILPELEKDTQTAADIIEITYSDNENPFLKLAEVIGKINSLGIEKSYLNLETVENIQQNGTDVRTFSDIGSSIAEMRMIKDAGEIEAIATASLHTDNILKKVKALITPGITEKEIKFELLRNIAQIEGSSGEAFSIQVSSGSNSSKPHGVTGNRKLIRGDTVVIDFGVNFKHYKSDMTRTLFVGKPNRELETVYKVVLKAQQKAIDIIKPGIPIQDIDRTAREIIQNNGYGDYFTHRIGHGLGIDIHEIPSINDQNKQLVKIGMVFSVEPGIYLPGLGGVRIEDSVAVVDNGCRVLNQFPKEIDDITIP